MKVAWIPDWQRTTPKHTASKTRVNALTALRSIRGTRQANATSLFDAGAPVQVGLDLEPRAAAESETIDLQVLHDPLHVIAGLGERDQLDPVDRVDLGIARVAVALDPFLDAAAAGIVGRERHDVGAAIILDQAAEFGGAEGRVVDRVGLHPGKVEAGAVSFADIAAGIRRHLHQPV